MPHEEMHFPHTAANSAAALASSMQRALYQRAHEDGTRMRVQLGRLHAVIRRCTHVANNSTQMVCMVALR